MYSRPIIALAVVSALGSLALVPSAHAEGFGLGMDANAVVSMPAVHASVHAVSDGDTDVDARGSFGGPRMRPAVFGTVASVSGSSFTVTVPARGDTNASTYTVNASGATVVKGGANASLADISVGDHVVVVGTTTGSTVTASRVMDGKGMVPFGAEGSGIVHAGLAFAGNGEPVVGGTVTAVSGSTLTVKNAAGATYTVDASGAAVTNGHATSTLSSLAVDDHVLVQGAVNGSNVTASSVLVTGTNASTTNENGHGFFHAMGRFFVRLFGFF